MSQPGAPGGGLGRASWGGQNPGSGSLGGQIWPDFGFSGQNLGFGRLGAEIREKSGFRVWKNRIRVFRGPNPGSGRGPWGGQIRDLGQESGLGVGNPGFLGSRIWGFRFFLGVYPFDAFLGPKSIEPPKWRANCEGPKMSVFWHIMMGVVPTFRSGHPPSWPVKSPKPDDISGL